MSRREVAPAISQILLAPRRIAGSGASRDVCLEYEFYGALHDSWVLRRGNLPENVAAHRCCRIAEAGVIHDIKNFGPENKLLAFPDREGARQAHIQIPRSRTDEGASAQVAITSDGSLGERSCVEPLEDARIGYKRVACKIRPIQHRALACERIVRSDGYGKRRASGSGKNSSGFPVSRNLAEPLRPEPGTLHDHGSIKDLPAVRRAIAVLRVSIVGVLILVEDTAAVALVCVTETVRPGVIRQSGECIRESMMNGQQQAVVIRIPAIVEHRNGS